MKLTFLGTGTSTGVPQLGCDCPVCRSAAPRDKRLRSSVLLEAPDSFRLLIDCGPDFRRQMLDRPFGPIDGVLLTHVHYDHVGGLDDLRPFCRFGNVGLWGEADCLQLLADHLAYCFPGHHYPGAPSFETHTVKPGETFRIGGAEIMPLRVMHGSLPILGYRVGTLAYITDMKTIPEYTLPLLNGISTLVVNGLRHEPHATHQTVGEAIDFSRRVGAARTYLTHLSHQAGFQADLEAQLPEGIFAAYDGLSVLC